MSQPHPEGRDPRVGELHLLGEVTWHGAPVHGGRTHALLAALVEGAGRSIGERALVDEVWGPDQPPANPAKALQVVVSRTRSQTAPEVVERTEGGYRLGLGSTAVDALVLRHDVTAATTAEARGERMAARDHARNALSGTAPASGGDGPLAALRDDARGWRAEAEAVLGRVLSALGDHREALPLLEAAGVGRRGDRRCPAAVPGRGARQPRGPRPLRAGEPRPRRPARRRPGPDPARPCTPSCSPPTARCARGCATSRPRWSAATTTCGRCARWWPSPGWSSIVGPGGLGKTRLAHLLGREAEQPVVHFVELVGVASPDDVVGEVGSALGVRDSVSGRRVLTAEQRNDVRARIAQALERSPALLILDNCEHVVEAGRRPRRLPGRRVPPSCAWSPPPGRPSRSPPSGSSRCASSTDDAASDLFGQRATAARPAVQLDAATVLSVVRRLDGLPLAIELAAAKVRAMSVEDIDRRLDDRFALLRGGDRSAPDRHQTLLAVIDWSLEPARRARAAGAALAVGLPRRLLARRRRAVLGSRRARRRALAGRPVAA